MKKVTLTITGTSHTNNMDTIQIVLESLPGVSNVNMDSNSGRTVITCHDGLSGKLLIEAVNQQSGFHASLEREERLI